MTYSTEQGYSVAGQDISTVLAYSEGYLLPVLVLADRADRCKDCGLHLCACFESNDQGTIQ